MNLLNFYGLSWHGLASLGEGGDPDVVAGVGLQLTDGGLHPPHLLLLDRVLAYASVARRGMHCINPFIYIYVNNRHDISSTGYANPNHSGPSPLQPILVSDLVRYNNLLQIKMAFWSIFKNFELAQQFYSQV